MSKEELETRQSFVFHFHTFNEIKESLYATFGASAYTILYYAGVGAGKRAFERRSSERTREEMLKRFIEDKSGENWGEITFDLDFARPVGKVLVAQSFEARTAKSDKSLCFFLKGYLTGFLSEIIQKPVVLNEVQCLAKGDDHCEFTVSPDK
jgi:predicted hydrocarbon binding protein